MKIGIYSDPHITKKIQGLDNEWRSSILETFRDMYQTFRENGVDFIICCGDFFDKSILEAKHASLLNDIVKEFGNKKTFMLLGNHEIDSNDYNILEVMSGYEQVTAVTDLMSIYGITFVPYNFNLKDVPEYLIKDNVVVTHHDIYGSVLAGGKVKASFGEDPNILSEARIVFNGHIHLRSVLGNIHNVGSLFSTQFGELHEGSKDHPCYYIYDTESGNLQTFPNLKSIHFIAVNNTESDGKLLEYYKELGVPISLRISYDYSKDETSYVVANSEDDFLNVSYRKNIKKGLSNTEVKRSETLDIRALISSYINRDEDLSDDDKFRIIKKSLDILGG